MRTMKSLQFGKKNKFTLLQQCSQTDLKHTWSCYCLDYKTQGLTATPSQGPAALALRARGPCFL